MPWDRSKKIEGEVLNEFAISNSIPSEKIFVTKDVENNAEEAMAVKELIGSSKRIILVTSAYDMYRAKRLFKQAGFLVHPYNVDYKAARTKAIKLMDFLPGAESLKQTKMGMRELMGRLFYLIKV